ncbi:MAG TPA: TlpA disulfide reductase family protein [Halanaerobiales bacterium]|nr:TlpA disulfide reductase family protein [Halanaerobiales bacterium]
MILRKNRTLIVFLTLVLIAAGTLLFNYELQAASDEDVKVGAQVGMKAPDFTLGNMSDNEITLYDFQGQKVFLNFWASWCPPCKAEMPAIQKLYKNNEEIRVLTVNVQENKDKVFDYLMKNNYSFTTLLDKSGSVSSAKYLVRGIPTTFVLDENSIIQSRHSGALTYEQMLGLISE